MYYQGNRSLIDNMRALGQKSYLQLMIRLKILDSNLHSPDRQLIELRMEHADLDALIDSLAEQSPVDELMTRRLKKRRLALRDSITRLEIEIDGKEPA
jgi:hypothetical protein